MKRIISLFLVIISISPIFAGAIVKEFSGKVKVKYDGDKSWSKIAVGQELPDNTLVSTGFNSQIVLDLGNSTLDVLPLTRMTIAEISESSDTLKTSLILQGGKIKADVGKVEGKMNDFLIKSPVATASVRGTAFEFSGNTLTVIRGEVAFTPTRRVSVQPVATQPEETEEDVTDEEVVQEEPAAQPVEKVVSVKAGGQTQMSSPDSTPVKPATIAIENSTVSASTKPEVKKSSSVETSEQVVEDSTPTPSDVQSQIHVLKRVTIQLPITESE